MGASSETWHRLSEIDREARTALCNKCGPVHVVNGAHGKLLCGPMVNARVRKRLPTRKPDGSKSYKFSHPETGDGRVYLNKGARAAILQDKACAICGAAENLGIDHCHTTGTIRGVLCGHCNSVLGFARDSPEILLKAATYLKSVA